MNADHTPRGKELSALSRQLTGAFFVTMINLFCALGGAIAQDGTEPTGTFSSGNNELVSIDFSNAPVGAPPKEIEVLSGKLDVVEKDGVKMLRSSEPAEFLVKIPEKIPDHFTVEADIVPKESGDFTVAEFAFEGTRVTSHSDNSAQVYWGPNRVTVIGGGSDYNNGAREMPEDVKEEVIGNLTEVRADLSGDSVKVYTNGKLVCDVSGAKFNHGRVIRFSLGGQDEDKNASYLAKLRVTGFGSTRKNATAQQGSSSTKGPGTTSTGKTQGTTTGVTGSNNDTAGTGTTGTTGSTGTYTDASGAGTGTGTTGTTGSYDDGTGAGTTTGATGTTTQPGTSTGGVTAPASVTGINVSVNQMGGASAIWDPVPGATSYFAVCWNIADPYGSKLTTSPEYASNGWQVGVLTMAGTYGFRVYAQTATGVVTGETQFNFGGVGVSQQTGTGPGTSNYDASGAGTGVTPGIPTGQVATGSTYDATGAGTQAGATGSTGQQSTGTTGSTAPATVTGIVVTVMGDGSAWVMWDPVPGATSYFANRWNVSDPNCCNQVSPPELTSTSWQAGVLPVAGTYGFRVIAKTANGLVSGETQFKFGGAFNQQAGSPTTGSTTTSTTGTVPTNVSQTPVPQPPESSLITSNAPLPTSNLQGTTTTTSATGLPLTGGTIVQPDGTTAPVSSGPRTVSAMTAEPAPSTLGTVEPIPETTVDGQTFVGTEKTGTSTTEPVTTVLATAPTQTGTITPTADSTLSQPANQTSGGGGATTTNLMQPASQTSGGSGGATRTTGRYRVMVTGFAAVKPTTDDPTNADGMGDEIFAAAAVVNWNRQTSQPTGYSFVQTRDYGDIAVNAIFGDRIRAGSAAVASGGIAAGNRVPAGYDPAGSSFPAPATDQFPLLVWEGTLNAGVEAVVISPSLWERDIVRAQLQSYKENWSKTSAVNLMNSPAIVAQLSTASITPGIAKYSTAVMMQPPTPSFSGPVADGYKMAEITFGPGCDRPIGLASIIPAVVGYQDHFILITQEKVAGLNAGEGITLSMPFAEPNYLFFGAIYTLYIRVERTQ